MKNIGIIGCGTIAKYIYQSILNSKNYQIKAVCDLSPKKTEIYAKRDVEVFKNYKTMLSNVECDIVILLVHHLNRKSILEYLLKNNYLVLCEKPLIWKDKQVAELQNISKATNNYPVTMYHRSWNFNVKNAVSYCMNNEIEKIEIYYLEDIKLHTSEVSNIYLSDDNGGGCVNDNFPNSIHFLLSQSSIKFLNADGKIDKNYNSTIKATVDLMWRNIPVTVYLDWRSEVDMKCIKVYDRAGAKTFDMQEGFMPGKDSLYHEYFNILNNLDRYNRLDEFKNSVKIGELMQKINRKIRLNQ